MEAAASTSEASAASIPARSSRHGAQRGLHGFDVFPAGFFSRCDRCDLRIKPGQLIRFHAKYSTAIHVECEALQRATVAAARVTRAAVEELGDLPVGVKPKTMDSYMSEWRLYVHFAERVWSRSVVPERDEEWNAFLLWKYVEFRSERYKPTTVFSAVSTLDHCGIMHGFVLPTTKFDGNPFFYKQIKNMKREISLRYRPAHPANGATFNVKRATPIGARSISLLLSHFQVYDKRSFLRLKRYRYHRHHLVVSMMPHTCGMRFGHFLWKDYRVSVFSKDLHGTFRLITD